MTEQTVHSCLGYGAHKCPVCSQLYTTAADLAEHIAHAHSSQPMEGVETTVPTFDCTKCEKSFVSDEARSSHIEKDHKEIGQDDGTKDGQASDAVEKQKTDGDTATKNHCPDCDQDFTDLKELAGHDCPKDAPKATTSAPSTAQSQAVDAVRSVLAGFGDDERKALSSQRETALATQQAALITQQRDLASQQATLATQQTQLAAQQTTLADRREATIARLLAALASPAE
ncbi:hypothetical protein LTR95_004906 [Oleoguttula sp. CCFEE 5521]